MPQTEQTFRSFRAKLLRYLLIPLEKIFFPKRFYFTRREMVILLVFLVIFVINNIYIYSVFMKKNKAPAKCSTVQQGIPKELVQVYVNHNLEEALKEDKGTGCDVPKLDPFAPEIMKFYKHRPPIKCTLKDWVKCYMSKCKVIPEILEKIPDVKCTYRDIIYKTDHVRVFGRPVGVSGNGEYSLVKSDFVSISCSSPEGFLSWFSRPLRWSGLGVGRRPVPPKTTPPGRENTINVFILAFDSTSKSAFLRRMPKSYQVLTKELQAVVMNRYNIVGDATPAAIIPLLTGQTEVELPEVRKNVKDSGYVDQFPLLFYKVKKDGYSTAYYEDMPYVGTFQNRFNGFRTQPADHYLRAFFLEEHYRIVREGKWKNFKYCSGDTPRFKLMLNLTEQFLRQEGKRFIFTFIADISHDDFNMLGVADEPLEGFLRGLKKQGFLEDTLLIVMGDHGSRYGSIRNTLEGKFEERLPFMAIRIPEVLKARRKEIEKNLMSNVEVLSTPLDVHTTILDALDMRQHWNTYKVKGADLARGLTLFQSIPKNRSCSEAGIEPHWCTCLKWEDVPRSEPLYQRLATALVDHINTITSSLRPVCATRELTTIHWIKRKQANKALRQFKEKKDRDAFWFKYGKETKSNRDTYQVKLTVGPGEGDFEAIVMHLVKANDIFIHTSQITRTNSYQQESVCLGENFPEMKQYCYCK